MKSDITYYEQCLTKFKVGEFPRCGCGYYHLKASTHIVHWQDKYWNIDCAFRHSLNMIIEEDEVYNRIEERLQNWLKRQP